MGRSDARGRRSELRWQAACQSRPYAALPGHANTTSPVQSSPMRAPAAQATHTPRTLHAYALIAQQQQPPRMHLTPPPHDSRLCSLHIHLTVKQLPHAAWQREGGYAGEGGGACHRLPWQRVTAAAGPHTAKGMPRTLSLPLITCTMSPVRRLVPITMLEASVRRTGARVRAIGASV